MFYERRVRTFDRLMREIRSLDSDAGVRIVGSYLDRRCFAFLTRSGTTYTVMVYGRRGGKLPVVGKRILSRDFASAEELGSFLGQIVNGKVEAYIY